MVERWITMNGTNGKTMVRVRGSLKMTKKRVINCFHGSGDFGGVVDMTEIEILSLLLM
jgi:hypothetical protein